MSPYLTWDTFRLLMLGLVSVAAIAIGAGTITSSIEYGQSPAEDISPGIEGNSTLENPSGSSQGDGDMLSQGDESVGGVTTLSWCAPFLPSALGSLVYFGAFAGLLALIGWRYSLGAAVFSGYGLAPIVLVAYFLSTDCATFGSDSSTTSGVRKAVNDASSTQLAQPEPSPMWLLGILGLVLVAMAAVILRATGDQTINVEEDEEDAGQTDVSDLAAAAGAAADRLERHNADVNNEVYRAWWEMTRLLDVTNPGSSTPGEFAEAAIDLGISEDDIANLTRLFEEVRYGDRDPEGREERAIEAFRNIEEEYGRDTAATTEVDAETGVDDTNGDYSSSETEGTDGS